MEKILYSKYSNERVRQFAIRTDIRKTADGGRVVVKQACYLEGQEHIAKLAKWYGELTALFRDTPFSMNRCSMDGECARLEYLEGRTLEEHLDELLLAGREEEAIALLVGYAKQVRRALSGGRFVKTPEFIRVFGDAELSGELACAPVTDIDMVAGNVLETGSAPGTGGVQGTGGVPEPDSVLGTGSASVTDSAPVPPGGWTLLDYEWTFDFPIPADFVIYRALKYYLYGNQIRALLQERDIYAMAGVGRENQRAFEEMEEHFQAYVRGDVVILAKLYEEISPGYISTGTDAEKRAGARGENLRFEVFFDRGDDFSARDSYDILYGGAQEVCVRIPAGADVQRIRLDPPVDDCLLWLRSVSWERNRQPAALRYTSNGTEVRPGLILFGAEDAQIIFEGMHGAGELKLEISLEPCARENVLAGYLAQNPPGRDMRLAVKKLRARAAKSAQKLQKTAAKGAAYIKKNGVISGVKRGFARMAKPVDYPDWLAACRMGEQEAAQMLETYRDTAAAIRVTAVGDLKEPEEGCFYLLTEKGGELEKEAPAVFAKAIRENPRAELFYCDSDRYDENGIPCAPCFKPDFDNYLLYSVNYIGAGFAVSGRLLARLYGRAASVRHAERADDHALSMQHAEQPDGHALSVRHAGRADDHALPGQHAECSDERAALYALLLACADEAAQIAHIPRVLYHAAAGDVGSPRTRSDGSWFVPQSRGQAEAEKRALGAYFKWKGINARVLNGAQPGIRHVVWPVPGKDGGPLVSVLIPNRDNARQLAACLESIREFAGYENLEILILENNSTEEETFALYADLEQKGRARILKWEGAFDFSRINNFGAEQARGSYLLFLNNDTKMCRKGCVAELLGCAAREDVGAVGARLYYPDGSIQHAGVIIGYGGVAGHAFEGFEKERQERTPWILTARQYSAVTAACMMVQKELFLSAGGFCGELGVAYNDVDLCLRLQKQGKKILYSPYAELVHYESQTRGLELTREKAERVKKEAAYFCARWKDVLESGDPCYNPNLTLDRADFSLAPAKNRRI